MRGRIVPEFNDESMAFERGLDGALLDAATAAVDEPHFRESRATAASMYFVDDRAMSAGKGVKVELGLDRNPDRGSFMGTPRCSLLGAA